MSMAGQRLKLAFLAVGVLVAIGLVAAGCGRTDLDYGIDTENTMIPQPDGGGSGGAGGRGTGGSGSGSGGGASSGSGGGAGSAGSGGKPSGGAGSTGSGGTGAAGSAGSTGSGGTGAVGVTGSGGSPTGAGGGAGGTGSAGSGGGSGGRGGISGSGGRGGSGGQAGGTGTGGGAGGGGSGLIPCGQMSCKAGAQACCIRPMTPPSCIAPRERCEGGSSLGCVDGSACGRRQVCCLVLPAFSSQCAPAEVCLLGPTVILCSADSQCPAQRPHCCRLLGPGVCQANPCGSRQP